MTPWDEKGLDNNMTSDREYEIYCKVYQDDRLTCIPYAHFYTELTATLQFEVGSTSYRYEEWFPEFSDGGHISEYCF